MSQSVERSGVPNLAERASRFMRNINIVGAIALGGAGLIVPELAAPLFVLSGVNLVQAAFFEGTRRLSARHGSRAHPRLA